MVFIPAQEVPPPVGVITDPAIPTPTNTDWGYPASAGIAIDPVLIGIIAVIIIAVFGILWYINRRLSGKEEAVLDNEEPELEDLFSLGWALNAYLAYNLIMMFIATIVGMIGAIHAFNTDMFQGITIIILAVLGTMTFRMWTERRSRGKSTKKYLEGKVVKKDGTKISYTMKGVNRIADYSITDTTRKILLESHKITNENLDKLYRSRCELDNGYEIIILTRTPYEEAFEWGSGFDLDIHGEFETDESTPELHEVGMVVSSEKSAWNPDIYLTKHMFVFLAAWDDSSSRKFAGTLDHINIEQNDILAALLVIMGAERHITTGELNAAKGEVLFLKRDGKNLDIAIHSLANAKAEEYVEDMRKLSALDSLKEYARVDYMLVVIALIIVGFGAYMWGYNNAMTQFFGGVGMVGLVKQYSEIEHRKVHRSMRSE